MRKLSIFFLFMIITLLFCSFVSAVNAEKDTDSDFCEYFTELQFRPNVRDVETYMDKSYFKPCLGIMADYDFQKAIDSKDVGFCNTAGDEWKNRIEDTGGQNMNVVVGEYFLRDYKVTALIDACNIYYALKSKDYTLCINNTACLNERATQEDNISICYEISDKHEKEDCLWTYGVKNKDIDACFEIEKFIHLKYECVKSIAKNLKDPGLCNQKEDICDYTIPDRKSHCAQECKKQVPFAVNSKQIPRIIYLFLAPLFIIILGIYLFKKTDSIKIKRKYLIISILFFIYYAAFIYRISTQNMFSFFTYIYVIINKIFQVFFSLVYSALGTVLSLLKANLYLKLSIFSIIEFLILVFLFIVLPQIKTKKLKRIVIIILIIVIVLSLLYSFYLVMSGAFLFLVVNPFI